MIKNTIKWQALSSVVVFSLSLVQLIILTRFLTLSDFGLVAIVMVVINISQVLADLGMANYLVYRQKITVELNSTVFWICLLSGGGLLMLLILLSPLVASLYDKPEITNLILISALSFIPISLSAQMQARYVCDFRLNELAKFDIVSKSIGTAVAVLSAYSDFGAASIILGGLATSVIRCSTIWLYADKCWLPKFLFSYKDAKSAWNYGVYQIGTQLINQLRANLDTLLLGFFIGSAHLGAYSLAKQLVQKPSAFILPIVQKISLPLLAASQSNMEKMRLLVEKAHTYVVALIIPPYILLCFLAEEVVLTMYGKDKAETSLFIIPLALFWMFRSLGGALVGSMSQGLGKTKIDFYWNLSVLGLYSLLCIVLAPHGAFTLAWGLALLQLLLINVIYLVFFKKLIKFKYSAYIYPILVFSGLSFLSILLGVGIIYNVSFYFNDFIYITSVSIFSIFFYYLVCYKFQNNIISLPNPYFFINKINFRNK
ncbi:oligosaccharide flippase family protein [Pseudoalteromonas sp. NZS127_1]|uniref:oligosaccharide flippase family protein n=1 Tax=Pseudoalteromonas sp. NZS127_1 TaxID=2792074 RepID=UPI0018CD34B7|nr:oligosaccharide flippase family protein [Pseudoalteromonas sp. NZS127_1]MBG9994700.1 oligosaccharide flippase family protein [Pseudoalteromonas sp. NZS127_1]